MKVTIICKYDPENKLIINHVNNIDYVITPKGPKYKIRVHEIGENNFKIIEVFANIGISILIEDEGTDYERVLRSKYNK